MHKSTQYSADAMRPAIGHVSKGGHVSGEVGSNGGDSETADGESYIKATKLAQVVVQVTIFGR